jgi:hypothetical protein
MNPASQAGLTPALHREGLCHIYAPIGRQTVHSSDLTADRVNRPGAATRPAVMRCRDPLVTVSHAQRPGKGHTQLKIISVKQACLWMQGVAKARPHSPAVRPSCRQLA